MSKKTDHIIGMTGTKKMLCSHCGTTLDIPLPIEISVFIAMSKAFVKSHKDCPCYDYCTIHHLKPK
jgi:hypothetical protein